MWITTEVLNKCSKNIISLRHDKNNDSTAGACRNMARL